MKQYHNAKDCAFYIDKSNCLALNWKDCFKCKFYKHKVFETPEIRQRKKDFKVEREQQLLASKGVKVWKQLN